MPSSATITGVPITVVAGTKARASHANSNWGVWRGFILPVDPNTMTSAHNTYDLGASDAQWRDIYLNRYPTFNGDSSFKLMIEALYEDSTPAEWFPPINTLSRTGFKNGYDLGVRFQFRVPAEYTPGRRISIGLRGYCETGPSSFVMEAVSALYRPGSDDASLTSPANVLTSTVNITPPNTSGQLFYDSSLRVSDASGLINLLSVTAGNMISVSMKRKGTSATDTNTGYFFLTEVAVEFNT